MHLPAAALIMTIDASFPPMGIVLVRMSPQTIFIYLSTDCMTRTHWPKDALIPDLSLEVADTGQEAVLLQGAGPPSPLQSRGGS